MRIRCTNAVICLGILAILVAMSPAAFAGIVTDTSELPPAGVYLGDEIHQLYSGAQLQYLLKLPEHRPFADSAVRTRGTNSDGTQNNDQIEIFDSKLNAVIEVQYPDGSLIIETEIELNGQVQTTVFGFFDDPANPGIGTFDTEIVALSLSTPNPLDGGLTQVSIGILPSPGQVTIVDNNDGTFQIDSFFDVFTELTLDDNQNQLADDMPIPGVGSIRMTLFEDPIIPEPGTLTLLAFAGLALLGYSWRRKRAA